MREKSTVVKEMIEMKLGRTPRKVAVATVHKVGSRNKETKISHRLRDLKSPKLPQ